MRSVATAILAIAAIFICHVPAPAQDYPSRSIHLTVPVAAGGGMDTLARLIAAKYGGALGVPIVVDNRPGGAENIGISQIARAEPDGYSLLLSSNSITINPSLYKDLAYDANKDLTPIGKVTVMPIVVATLAPAPNKTLSDLIAYAKANPRKLSYGTPGVGTPHHLGMELLKSEAGIELLHVPYRGTAPGLTDLLAGNIGLLISTITPIQSYLDSGQLHAIATFSPKRLAQYPAIPTASETFPGFNVEIWHGVFAPSMTPAIIRDKLTEKLSAVMKDEELIKQLNGVGILTSWEAPEELRAEIPKEQAQWASAIKQAGITGE
jgi:tripartite-type tricarboxylate transporter receptor subunit TctC